MYFRNTLFTTDKTKHNIDLPITNILFITRIYSIIHLVIITMSMHASIFPINSVYLSTHKIFPIFYSFNLMCKNVINN